MNLVKRLQDIGLTEKESKVYNALLELGDASANDLSKKSGLNRITTYAILQGLVKQKLASTIEKHKKTYFIIEHPNQILDLLEKEKQHVEIKIKLAKELMPELEMLEKITGEKATVKLYEGHEGVLMIRKDIAREDPKIIDQIFNLNITLKRYPSHPKDHRHNPKNLKRGGRILLVYNPKEPIPEFPRHGKKKEYRYIPEGKTPFFTEILIYNSKAVFLATKDKRMAVMIENKNIVSGLRFIFDLAWQGAEKFSTLSDKKKKK